MLDILTAFVSLLLLAVTTIPGILCLFHILLTVAVLYKLFIPRNLVTDEYFLKRDRNLLLYIIWSWIFLIIDIVLLYIFHVVLLEFYPITYFTSLAFGILNMAKDKRISKYIIINNILLTVLTCITLVYLYKDIGFLVIIVPMIFILNFIFSFIMFSIIKILNKKKNGENNAASLTYTPKVIITPETDNMLQEVAENKK